MTKRYRVTDGGLFGADGELPVGFEFDMKDSVPAGWASKVALLSSTSVTPAHEPVVNPSATIDQNDNKDDGGGTSVVVKTSGDEPDPAPVPKAKTKKRENLEAQAEKAGVEFNDDMSDDDLTDAIMDAKGKK